MNIPNTRGSNRRIYWAAKRWENLKCQPLTGCGTQIHGMCVAEKRKLYELWALAPSRDLEEFAETTWAYRNYYPIVQSPVVCSINHLLAAFVQSVLSNFKLGIFLYNLICLLPEILSIPVTDLYGPSTTCLPPCGERDCGIPSGPPAATGFKPFKLSSTQNQTSYMCQPESPAWGVNTHQNNKN